MHRLGLLLGLLAVSAGLLPAQSHNPILRPPGFEPRFPYSPGVIAGDLVFIAGQGSRDPKTGRHPEGFEAQVRQAIDNMRAVLQAGGLDLPHLASCHVYLDDLGNYGRMNTVYGEMMKEAAPVRTTIAVPALPDESHVEITCIAARDAATRKPVYRDNKPPTKPGLFPPGMRVGNWVFTSGVGSRNPATGKHPEGFPAQVRQVMDTLGEVLKSAGLGFPDAVWANVYLDDAANTPAADEIYNSYFPKRKPARTVSIVKTIPGDSHVEITLLAAAPGARLKGAPGGATMVDNTLFLSAQSAPGGSIEEQVRKTLDKQKTSLAVVKMDMADVVNAHVYLRDLADFPRMNAVYRTYFPKDPPARTTVQVKQPGSSPDAAVEISLVAFK